MEKIREIRSIQVCKQARWARLVHVINILSANLFIHDAHVNPEKQLKPSEELFLPNFSMEVEKTGRKTNHKIFFRGYQNRRWSFSLFSLSPQLCQSNWTIRMVFHRIAAIVWFCVAYAQINLCALNIARKQQLPVIGVINLTAFVFSVFLSLMWFYWHWYRLWQRNENALVAALSAK